VVALAFGASRVALLFTLANLFRIVRRAAIEDQALAPNRTT
jgi:isoprenylcysteine carboxyl methyltransferase (ICMT) family protein YpbQ